MKKTVFHIISTLFLLALVLLFAGCAPQAVDQEITNSPMMSETEKQIEAVSVMYRGQEIILTQTEITALSELFAKTEVEEFLNPSHEQGQYSDPLYTIKIGYADKTADIVFSTETGRVFYKFTGTAGTDGTAGYILVRSDDICDFLANLDWRQ